MKVKPTRKPAPKTQEPVSETESEGDNSDKASEGEEQPPVETETDSSMIESTELEGTESESGTEAKTEEETQEEESRNSNEENTTGNR